MATFEVDVQDRSTGVNAQAMEYAERELQGSHERVAAAEKSVLEAELHLAEADARLLKSSGDARRKAGFVQQKARCESNFRTATLEHERALTALHSAEEALERAKNPFVVREWKDLLCVRLITCGFSLCSRGSSDSAVGETSRADRALDMLSEASVGQGEDVEINPVAQLRDEAREEVTEL
jgi:membrane protein involved in colicin uptake